MSHVAASLLVSAANDAENAFVSFAWLMRSLPPNYFDEGYRVEVRALRILAALRWPDVVAPTLYEALDLVAGQWLLSVWAGVLSHQCCYAVWARMVREERAPADTSLRVALTLLSISLMQIHEAAASEKSCMLPRIHTLGSSLSLQCSK